MKRPLLIAALGLVALYGYGCSGGGTPDPNATPSPTPTPTPTPSPTADNRTALQKLLSGSSATGSKRWTFVAIKPNASFTSGGGHTGEQESCPIIYSPKESIPAGSGPSQGKILLPSCWPTDYIEFRADGKARVGSTGDSTPDDFTLDWNLAEPESGAVLSGPLQSHLDGPRTGTFGITQIPTTGFLKQVRLKVISASYPGTDPRNPSTAGFEYVLEGPPS